MPTASLHNPPCPLCGNEPRDRLEDHLIGECDAVRSERLDEVLDELLPPMHLRVVGEDED